MLRRPALRAALAATAVTALLGLSTAPALASPDGHGTAGPDGEPSERPMLSRTLKVSTPAEERAAKRAEKKAANRLARRVAADSPLSVTITDLTPSTLQERGRVRVTGTVTNTTDESWANVNVYAFISPTPLTTPAQLDEAAQSDPSTYVGDRVADDERFRDTIAELAPGASAPYSISVPRKLLPVETPGVYWFGTQALGENAEGRDEFSDGRARTFLPLVPEAREGSLPTAVAIPLRHQLVYADDGSVDDLAGWVRTLSRDGRLRSLVDLGEASGSQPVTWVIDPGLIDAVRRLAAGNPPRSLAANLEPGQEDGEGEATDEGAGAEDGTGDVTSDGPVPTDLPTEVPTEAPTGADAPSEVPSPDAGQEDGDSPLDLDDLDPVVQAAADAAQSWLDRLSGAMRPDDQVLTLPYGDVDVAGAAAHDPQLLQRAVARSATGLAGIDAATSSTYSSPSGFLSAAGLQAVGDGTTVLMSDAELPAADTEAGAALAAEHPAALTTAGRRVLLTSRGAGEGGPGPDERTATVAMRQRLLSEAAVRFLQAPAERTPLTVMLPHDWTPTDVSSYFPGLEVPWLDLDTVAGVDRVATAVPLDSSQLRYPAWQAQSELGPASFEAADDLMRSGIMLQNLLTLNNIVSGTVTDQALGTASYSARTRPVANRSSAMKSRTWIEDQVQQVTIDTPPAVTLSSSSGRFSATIVNQLDEPVTVALDAQTDGRLTIEGPTTIQLPARGRRSLLLTASTDENGIHDVRLGLTDKRGAPLGSATTLSIRSAQVSDVIWLFIGGGAALLFGAIGLRLYRRIRNARRTPPAAATATGASLDREPAGAR